MGKNQEKKIKMSESQQFTHMFLIPIGIVSYADVKVVKQCIAT